MYLTHLKYVNWIVSLSYLELSNGFILYSKKILNPYMIAEAVHDLAPPPPYFSDNVLK